MTDRAVVALAASAWLAATVSAGLPVWLVVGAICASATTTNRRKMLLAGALLVTFTVIGHGRGSAPATSAASPPSNGTIEIELASDPRPITRGVVATALWEDDRWDVVAWGSTAGHLRHHLMGETLTVEASVRRDTSLTDRTQRRWNQTAGSLTLESVESVGRGPVHARLANVLRRTIERGATSLSRDHRALLTGFVYGDDRGQDDLTSDDFLASGLTHLLAVSGSNVAFVLLLVGPVLRRSSIPGRFVVTLAVLFVFATLTRFEPSVLRASVMAAVAALAITLGRTASSVRILGLAVTLLVTLWPDLVWSVGFRLSVVASIGILVLGPRIVERLSGPRLVVEAVAVTAAAQLAVAPLLVAVFGGVPVASLPANVAAAPLAGPIMTWGLTAGLLAGVVGEPLASLLHVPTKWMLDAIEAIASLGATLPLGQLTAMHVVLCSIGTAAAVFGARGWPRQLGVALILGALIHPAVAVAAGGPRQFDLGEHTQLWNDGETAVLALGAAPMDELIERLRLAHVPQLDVVVLPRGNLTDWSRVQTIQQRWPIGTQLAPHDETIAGVTVVRADVVLVLNRSPPTTLTVTRAGDRLTVTSDAPVGVEN